MAILDNFTLFGYSLVKDTKEKRLETFEVEKDAAVDIVDGFQPGGGAYALSFETVSVPTSEVESIKTYRNIAANADVDLILNEIRNEFMIFDVPGKKPVDVSFPDQTAAVSRGIQKRMHEEFDEVYRLLNFKDKGIEFFSSWYVDSRIYFHVIIDQNDKKAGIKRLVQIDPLKIRKIRELPPKDPKTGTYDITKVKEYYVYVDQPDAASKSTAYFQQKGLKIQKDSIICIDSGILRDGVIKGFLDKAIVPFNNLKLMEESLLIYRVSRAPERRVIYVDVGNLPKNKAEQYIRDLMNRFRNKIVYDTKTGSIADKRNVLSMMEDYWLPRRDGGKGTEITTLPGGENLGITADIEYFKDKLLDSLNVPSSRFGEQPTSFVFGKGVEISRDEYRFKKYIDRLRQKFSKLFMDLLRVQVLLKNVATEEDWQDISEEIIWVYAEDNAFTEFKESEILNNRINTVTLIDPFVGKYVTREWVMKNILKMNDKEYDEMIDAMKDEQDEHGIMSQEAQDQQQQNFDNSMQSMQSAGVGQDQQQNQQPGNSAGDKSAEPEEGEDNGPPYV